MTDYNGSNTPVDIRDLWQTPPELFKALDREFHFKADIAASHTNHLHPKYLTLEDDALSSNTRWELLAEGNLWCNPPYSDITPWVEKASMLPEGGNVGVVMLVPSDTSVGWFKLARKSCTEVRFITGGRISFVRADTKKPVNGNNKGSMLLIWNPMRHSAGLTGYADRDELMNYGRHICNVKERAA